MEIIDQNFANSLNDAGVTAIINAYISTRDTRIPNCNCGGSSSKNCVNETIQSCIPTTGDGGVYTRLDSLGGMDFSSHIQTLDNLYASYNNLLNRIKEKKEFIDNPPDPNIPDLGTQIQKRKDDIADITVVMNEISYFINQIKIDLA